MHWYFALSEVSIDREGHDWRNLIRVAVQSAKMNTRLVPHMLYDGRENIFTQELQERGVNVIQHRVSFYDALEKHGRGDRNYLGIASGAFLRFDIPLVEKTSDFVLYTDCDVLFRSDPNFFHSAQPDFFAATSQTALKPDEDMNSGVMLINVAGMRSSYLDLVAFTKSNLQLGLDQEVLRVFFASRYMPMDMSLNWKPYWGVNPAAQIVHYHGPKPVARQKLTPETLASAPQAWQELYLRNPGAYVEYGRLWDSVLENYDRELLSVQTRELANLLRQQLESITVDRDRWRAQAESLALLKTQSSA